MPYGQAFYKQQQNKKRDYLPEEEDQGELNNEGELIGYSEQIIGKINDMAPGIPNQDEVLCHQPPEAFVNMMHE